MNYLLFSVLLATLTACGGSTSHDEAPPNPQAKETVFDPMINQLDRVKQQAETLPKERKDNLDRAIEGDAP